LNEAATLYAWLVERRPQDLLARMSLTYALIQLDRVAEAARCLPALEHLPNPALHYLIGRIRAAAGDTRAAEAFERFATLQRSEHARAVFGSV